MFLILIWRRHFRPLALLRPKLYFHQVVLSEDRMRDDAPSAEDICTLLEYDPATGQLTWKDRPRTRGWRPDLSGPVNNTTDNGRLRVGLFGKRYLAHRIIWCMVTGAWPTHQIDHINGDPSDNRWCNLRHVTNLENCRNQKRRANNVTGMTGVLWRKDHQVWTAQIQANGKREHLGFFASKEEAIAARHAAEQRHGYHPNHGRR